MKTLSYADLMQKLDSIKCHGGGHTYKTNIVDVKAELNEHTGHTTIKLITENEATDN